MTHIDFSTVYSQLKPSSSALNLSISFPILSSFCILGIGVPSGVVLSLEPDAAAFALFADSASPGTLPIDRGESG